MRCLSTNPYNDRPKHYNELFIHLQPELKSLKNIKEIIKTQLKPNKLALIMATNKVVPLSIRAKFSICCPIVYRYYKPEFVLNDLIGLLSSNIARIKNKLKKYSFNTEVMKQINSGFIPSKTVQLFLNLITEEDEIKFKKDESHASQISCKVLLILMNVDFDANYNDSNNNYVKYLYRLMKKKGIYKIKELLFFHLCGNINITPQMHYDLEKIVEANAEVFDLNNEILKDSTKITKIFIYFILDLTKFIQIKCSDGTFLYTLRLLKLEEISSRIKLKKIKNEIYS